MAVIDDLKQEPYWDDYSPEQRDFLRILFRPGYAVQARELNQLQAILQTQVERFGNHIFKDGSIVIGGMTTIDVKTPKYLKINDTYSSVEVNVNNFLNKEIVGLTSGAKGLVTVVVNNEGSDPKTLIYKPTNGYSFSASENIQVVGTASIAATVQSSSFNGKSSTVSIDAGIFYTKGIFVINSSQTAYLTKYVTSDDVTNIDRKAGLLSDISIITENQDETLLDNANGSYNYAAPGAHRLKIDLTLVSKALDFTADADKFIELLEVRDGALYKQVTRPIYSEIETTLARRTYDESGDYTVKPFLLDLQNHPTDSTKLRAYLDSGKGYVKGYEFETIARQYVDINKARDTETYNNYDTPLNYGNYVIVTLTSKFPDISSFETVKLYHTSAGEIGSAQVSSIKIHDSSLYQYKLFLFNTTITNTSYTFSDVRTIRNSAGSTTYCTLVSPYKLYDTDLQSYVFKTGIESIKTFKDGVGATDTDYSTKRVFLNKTVSANVVSIQTANSSERFQGTAGSTVDSTTKAEHYVIVDATTGSQLTTYTLQLDAPGSGSVQTATITFTSQTNPVSIIATVNVNNSSAIVKTKQSVKTHTGTAQTATSNTITLASTASSSDSFYNNCKIKLISGTGSGSTTYTITGYVGATKVATISGTFSTTPNSSTVYQIAPPTAASDDLTNGRKYSATSTGTISLSKADAIRIIKIVNSTTQDDWFDNTKDVTNRYSFDNGQRDFSYELASITLKAGQTAPTGAIVIFFEYFSSSGAGYFNVDSYSSYDEVPNYVSSSGEILDLRNCVDFRPMRFDSSTYITSNLPVSRTNMNADLTYYLPRVDKIVATTDRKFKVIEGVSSINAKPPKDLDNGMTIYSIYMNPYTFNNLDTVVKYIENKRYTMRDIGKLEKRIENMEYYTLLTSLEKETSSMDIKDAAGNSRFKNGFVVDSFKGHSIGDVYNSDYKCSVDFKNQEARPRFKSRTYNLGFKSTESTGYNLRGSLLTRDFNEVEYIKQPFASQSVNVNPYSVFSWRGTITLTPSTDFWKDDTYRPANVINTEGNNDNIAFGTNWSGSRWNDWQETFNGDTSDWSIEDRLANGELGASLPSVIIPLIGPGSPSDPGRWFYQEINGVPSWVSGLTGEIAPAQLGSPAVVPTVEANTNRGTTTTNSWFTPNTTSSSSNTTTINLGERVVDVSYSPWMRTIDVSFSAIGMKPNTVVYPFFDDVKVTAYVTPSGGSLGGTLTTSSSGSISGTFRIPANTFLTGDRLFRLSDNVNNDPELETTFSQTRFTANGILNHKQLETVNIRIPQPVSPPRVPVPIDPVAQTFFVDPNIYNEGLFISSVDLYFKSADTNIPVTVQIRRTINGYPSSTEVLPFAEKTLPAASVSTSTDASIATNFQFPSVVYLEPGEYSIVVLANSNNYEVFIAEIGKNKLGTTDLITEQAYVGSFFKSQNASTWTAEQTQDLKFVLKRCNFTAGNFDLVLSDWPDTSYETRTITATGSSGSPIITVSDITGLSVGQTVANLGATGIAVGSTISSISGFNVTLSANNTATVSGTVTVTGKREGNGKADVVWVGNSVLNFKNGTSTSSIITKPVGSVIETSYTPIIANKNYEFTSQRELLATTESFKHKITGTVISPGYVSPVVDMEKNNLIAIENIVDNIYERTTTTTGATGSNSTVINLNTSQYVLNGNLLRIGSEYMLVTAGGGATGATGVTVTRSQLGSTAANISSGATVYLTSELFPYGGPSASKYITRKILLKNAANYLKVYLTAVRPSGTDIKVYYKIRSDADSSLFSNKSWVEMTKEYPGDNAYSKNNKEFLEYVYLPPSTSPNTTSTISYDSYNNFIEFAIKIVFLSSSTSTIPRIADFRAIALDSL